MSWFESLKEFIGVHLHLNINNSVNIQINSNNVSKPLEYNQEDNLLSINLERLDAADLEKFREISREAVNEGSTLLRKQSQERIIDIKSKEELADVRQLLAYFQGKIPPHDFVVLRQAVYIKKLFEDRGNAEVIFHLKGEVAKKYGQSSISERM